tara:strand:+ start:342 stop:1010 length:669 start_codon:yes stop_codon:yes gene_type:complete
MGNFSIAQKGTTSFGLQLKPIVPVSYFQAGPLNLSDTIVDIEIKQKLGYSMGMIIRHNITDLISFETGINYVRRNYAIAATSKIGTLNDQLEFGFVNYEIPLQALVYVQLSKRIYMNVSSGIGLNAYPSHVISSGENLLLEQLSLRGRIIGLSYLANIGFEYKTEEKGNFYLGASLVTPLSPITETKIKYEYQNATFSEFTAFLNGNYITIDLRYFFPAEKE